MGKKKDKADVISDLLELAEKLKLPDGALDNEVDDEAIAASRVLAENINKGSLMDQLEFLYDHGFTLGRLEELIREYSA